MEGNLETGTSASLQAVLEQGQDLSASDAIGMVAGLADEVHRRHIDGQLHRAIDIENIAFDEASSTCSLSTPSGQDHPFGGMHSNEELCPPELRGDFVLTLPRETKEVDRILKQAGLSLDPRRIDIYQLGTLLCRLLTGESIQSYLRSPRVKGKVPAPLQPVIEQAIGYNSADRFTDAAQLATALRKLQDEDQLHSEVESNRTNATHDPDDNPLMRGASTSERDTNSNIISNSPGSDTSIPPVSSDASRASVSSSSSETLPFERLGHYEIVGRIGQGGMGDVYKGYERSLDRTVAIKVLPQEFARQEDFVRRFKTEATAVAKLVHPNIVQIYFIGEDQGLHFFAMQYVEGEPLGDLLSRRDRLNVDETLAIVEQVLSGLAAAHQQGLVHRDVKPGNILLDRGNHRALLADFGLVKASEDAQGMTATGVVMGTVDYISPEQGRGQPVDGRTDLYSVGVLMYQMLSGRLPFEADSPTAMIFQHVYEQAAPLVELVPNLPTPLAAIIAKLLSKAPDDRHKNAQEVLDDLSAFRANKPLPSGVECMTPEDDSAPINVISGAEPEPPSRREQTAIIEVPRFATDPVLPMSLYEPTHAGWWHNTRDRFLSMFRQVAPEIIKDLQSTQQQIDGAVAEYERRRNELTELVREAESAVAELQQQVKNCQTEAAQALRKAEAASDDATARLALRAKQNAQTAAKELEEQIAEQKEQLEAICLHQSQVSAKYHQLKSQRDLLTARFKAAQARAQAAGGYIEQKQSWRPLVLGGTALAASLVIAVLVARLFRSDSSEAVPVSPIPSVSIPPSSVPLVAKLPQPAPVAKLPVVNSAPNVLPFDGVANRRAAEWVLDIGGTVIVSVEGLRFVPTKKRHTGVLFDASELPSSAFQITQVGFSRVKKPIPDSDFRFLQGLSALESLALDSTEISGVGLQYLAGSPRLMDLDISYSLVNNAGFEQIAKLPDLQVLTAKHCKTFNDAGLEHLRGHKELRALDFYDSRTLTEASLEILKTLPKLELLAVPDMQITDVGLEQIQEMQNLVRLNMGPTKIADDGLTALKSLSKLKHLTIRGINDNALEPLKTTQLVFFQVIGPNVTDKGLEHLKEIKTLQTLYVIGTSVTEAGVNDFKTALPECNVKY